MKLNRADFDLILIHAFWGFIATFLLSAEAITLGWRIFWAVLSYHIVLPLFARQVNYKGWMELWMFLLMVSALQVFPDWFLAQGLGVLTFPDTGSPLIGPVPIFMAGMWTIPLFIIVYIGRRFKGKYSALITALVSALVFLSAEATLWALPIWQAQNVTQVFHIAIYLIIPETILGVITLRSFEWSLGKALLQKIGAAAFVMLSYLASISGFYWLVEKVILK